MAVTSTTRWSQFTLTGSGQTLAISTWFIQAAADVTVVSTNATTLIDTVLALNTDYTLTGVGNTGGFSVVMVAGANTDIITVYGAAAETQPTVYTSNNAFPAKTTENAIDRIVMLLQQLQNNMNRCLRVPVSNTTIGAMTIAARKNTAVTFDASGNLLLADTTATTMPAYTLKGNNTGSAAAPLNLTVAQTKTLLAYAQADITGLTTGDSPQFTGLNLSGLSASRLVVTDGSKNLASNALLTANGAMYATAAGGVASTAAFTNGQLLVGSTGVAPVAATLTGTANQITVTNGAGSITLALPQNIHTAATPTFGGLTLNNGGNTLLYDGNGLSLTNAGGGYPGGLRFKTTASANTNFWAITQDTSHFLNFGYGALGSEANIFLINTSGAVVTGLWQATPIATTYGGVPTGGTTSQVLSKSSNSDYVMAWSNVSGVLAGLTTNAFVYASGSASLASTAAATDGQLLIGKTGAAPVAAALAGTANQVVVTNGAGTITLALPQSIHTAAKPTFTGITNAGTLDLAATGANIVTISTNGVVRAQISSTGIFKSVAVSNGTTVDSYTIDLQDTTALAAGVGPGIAFEGVYTAGGALAQGGGIRLSKLNNTDGNYSFDLVFTTRQNGSGVTEAFRLKNDQSAVFASTIATADPTNGSGAWKLGKVRTGVALTVSTTTVLEVMVDGTRYDLALTTSLV